MTDAATSPSSSAPAVVVVGAGPAGLMAAEVLAGAGVRVTVVDRMPSPARKLLMAGRGGLNLTHSEEQAAFIKRYGTAQPSVAAWLSAFSAADLRAWADGLGQETFVGSSGRVFPRAMKASPLLRAWLARLEGLGVTLRTRTRWVGWRDGTAMFETADGPLELRADALVLAMGGASWPRLGSDGGWTPAVERLGAAVAPLRPANSGLNIAWSDVLRERFAGAPLKPVGLTFDGRTVRGEVVVTRYGLEGSAVYALSEAVGEALRDPDRTEPVRLTLDLRPDLSAEALAARLDRPRGKDSLTNHLRKAGGLSPAAIGVLRDIPGEVPTGATKLALRIKAVRLEVTGLQGLERAISTAGGVMLDDLDQRLMVRAAPGVFVAGEMLDWTAPTGGYLLQASMASGVVAARGVLDWLSER